MLQGAYVHRVYFRAGSLFAALLVLAACSSEDQVVSATEEGAARIVAGIKEHMDIYLADTPEVDFQWVGEVTAVPAGDHYEVTLPAVGAVIDGGRFDIGQVKLTVIANADGTYRFDAKLPPEMTASDYDGIEIARLSIGGQSHTGLWLPAWSTSLDYKFAYDKVSIDIQPPGEDKVRIDIGRLAGVSSTTPTKGDLLDVKSHFEAADFSVSAPDGALSVKSNRIESAMNSIDVGRFMGALEELQQFQAKHTVAGLSGVAGPEAKKQVLALMEDLITSYGEGLSLDWSVKGIALDGNGKRMTLDGLTLGMNTVNGSLGSMGVRFGLDGFGMDPAPLPGELLPTRFAMDLQAGNLPVKEVWANFVRLMELQDESGSIDPKMQALIGQDMVAALSAATSELRLQNFSIASATSALDASGGLTVSKEAAMGMTADYTLVVRDMGSVTKALSPAAGQQPDQKMTGALMFLGMLQGMGRAGAAEDGVQTLTYDIKIAPDGKILLNGNDLSALMGAMGGAR